MSLTQDIIALEAEYIAQNYAPLPVVITRGEGVHVWDVEGKQYIDCVSAYSAVSHGHCHPRLVQALVKQAGQLSLTSRAFYHDKLASFLKRLCLLTGQDKALPMNTGAEAVETAIKAARKWAYTVKSVPKDSAEIIACNGNFHGRTTTIVGLSSEHNYRQGFGPFPPGLKRIPYGQPEALEKAITPNTAAFLVEPIQGEGGIIIPPKGYLKTCADICRDKNVLLLCDEVQTGLGRTGRLLDCEYESVKPDGLILGKALGGGLLPVSAFLARNEVMSVFTPGDHGSTFGGNPLGAAVANEALSVLLDEKLIEKAYHSGEYLRHALKQQLTSKAVKAIRGRGLLIGIEVDPNVVDAHDMALALLKRGVLTKDTHHTVLRLAPPLIVTRDVLDQIVERLVLAFTPYV